MFLQLFRTCGFNILFCDLLRTIFGWINFLNPPTPKFNIAPEELPSQMENTLTTIVQGLCQTLLGVSFMLGRLKGKLDKRKPPQTEFCHHSDPPSCISKYALCVLEAWIRKQAFLDRSRNIALGFLSWAGTAGRAPFTVHPARRL